MERRAALFGFVALITCAGLSPAHAGAGEASQLVEEVLERSGANRQLAEIQAQIEAQGRERAAQLDPKAQAAVTQIMARAFRPEFLYAITKESFVADFDPQQATALLTWLQSPLSRRIVEFEVRAAAPQAREEMTAYFEGARNVPPAATRVALVQALDDATEGTPALLDLLAAMIRGLAAALDPLVSPDKRLKEGEFAELLRASEPALRTTSLATALFVYRNLSDDELYAYVQVCRSDAGKWYFRTLRKGLVRAVGEASRLAGEEIGRAGLAGGGAGEVR